MATIVDALLVTLGLDVSGFMAGQKKTGEALKKTRDDATATAKTLDAQGKKAAQFFGQIRDGILGVTAAALGAAGIKSFVENTTASGVAVGRLAKNLNMGVEELSAWEGVMRRLGGSTEEADGMFRGINSILQEIKLTGSSAAITPLVRAGMDLGKFMSGATSGSERMLMIADAVKKLSPQDAQSFFQQAGFSEAQVSRLMEGRKQLEALLETQRKYNGLTPEMVANDNERIRAWREIVELATGLANKMLDAVSPAIKFALDAMRQLLQFAAQHIPETTTLALALGAAFTAIAAIKIAGLISAIGALTGGLGGASTAAVGLLGLLGRMGLIGATVAAGTFAANGIKDVLGAGKGLYDINQRQGVTLPGTSGAGGGTTAAMFASLEGRYGLPAGLLDAVYAQESGRGRNLRSKAGAKGPFQFMDATAKQYGLANPDDLGEAASAAARMFADLLKQTNGNLPMALAGYNAGMGNVRSGKAFTFAETRNYVPSVMNRMRAGNSSKTEIHVGAVNVHTTAKDGKGIAQTVGTELRNLSFAQQANYSFN